MNCDGVRGLLSAYMDGELSSGELLRVEQHLRRCHSCTDEVDSLRQTIALVASMDAVAIPAAFHAQLHNRLVALGPPVPAVRRIPAAPGWQRNLGRWAVPAAAAAAVVAFGLTSMPQAQKLAVGLAGRPGTFKVEPAQQVAKNPTKQADPLTSPPPVAPKPSGKSEDPGSIPSTPDVAIAPPGGPGPAVPLAPNTPTPTPPVSPPNKVPIPDSVVPPVAPVPSKGTDATPATGGGTAATGTTPEQPPVQLTPKLTFTSDATVTTANADNMTKALAAYHPNIDGDTLYVTVPANQRKAVEDAVRNASAVQVLSGFEARQTDL
ncbi:MAG: hypothetical protein JWN15_327, partial [Firmicutes bacterium]|nr:hypothetical protein [Bacillota bacterium]